MSSTLHIWLAVSIRASRPILPQARSYVFAHRAIQITTPRRRGSDRCRKDVRRVVHVDFWALAPYQPVVKVRRCTEADDAPGSPGAKRENTGSILSVEQRREAGCSVRRMQTDFYHGLLRRTTDQLK
jgi:hypothetical protein